MKNIRTIGYEIPDKSELILSFSEHGSLMDADIILIAPNLPYYEKSAIDGGYYKGKTCYGSHGSFDLKRDLKHWKNELRNALHAGKTVFLFLSEKEEYFVETGDKEHKGKRTTLLLAPGHNYELLPESIGTITSAHGKHIESTGHPLFKNFFKQFKKDLKYHLYLEDIGDGKPIFIGKDKTKILGALFQIGAGNLVVLPYLDYDEEKFTEVKKEKDGEEIEYWTDEATEFGNKLVQALVEIDNGMSQEFIKSPPPAWTTQKKFLGKKEVKLKADIEKSRKKIDDIDRKIKQIQIDLFEEQILRDLLFEQGKPLENAIIKALRILGYEAENYDDGEVELDQIILSPEGERYIGESEGKDSKAINIAKFRHLIDGLNDDFARDEVDEKGFGILFGNPERLEDPQKRKLDFTEKCKRGAKREGIALIKTVDLYKVAMYLNENSNESFKKQCREAIKKGLGKIVEFPNLPKKR